MKLCWLLALLTGCGVTAGPGYVEDFAEAFCSYQARCSDPIALDTCQARTYTFDECLGLVERNRGQLEHCTWNVAFAQACIEAYENLHACPSEGAPHPDECSEVYSGGEDCAAFPYPLCESGDTGDTGTPR